MEDGCAGFVVKILEVDKILAQAAEIAHVTHELLDLADGGGFGGERLVLRDESVDLFARGAAEQRAHAAQAELFDGGASLGALPFGVGGEPRLEREPIPFGQFIAPAQQRLNRRGAQGGERGGVRGVDRAVE